MKICKACREKFEPQRPMQVVCSPKCAYTYADKKAAKAREAEKRSERRERKVRAIALKPRSEWLREAQRAFNAYIRQRDSHLPCISCQTFPSGHGARGGIWDCGHYRSTGANPELRFEELNAHKQCKRCNQQLSGNVVNYRIHLLKKIGHDKLGWLEGPHEAKKYTVEDLRAIRDEYRKKLKQLQYASI